MDKIRIALAQINTTVGDLDNNTAKIINYVNLARSSGADLIAFPELTITGYPPEDLLFKSQFIEDNIALMNDVVQASKNITVVVGFVDSSPHLYNSAAVAHDGKLIDIYHKHQLPNYGVFDEKRYFSPGNTCPIYVVEGIDLGVNICEDIWHPDGPTSSLLSSGARVIVNISSSPYYAGRLTEREKMLTSRAKENDVFIAYVNLVGGQDELVFDGASMLVDPKGQIIQQGYQFKEDLVITDLEIDDSGNRTEKSKSRQSNNVKRFLITEKTNDTKHHLSDQHRVPLDELSEVYTALVTGTRDYVYKTGFDKVLIALSGGIDSSLVTTIATDALGPDNVVVVAMPSRYSSDGSLNDAKELADNLGVEFQVIPIEPPFTSSLDVLKPHFEGHEPGLAEENLQSRIRGLLIMALSNKKGWLVLTTGNKSEMAVGYATIYGDMAGGYAVIKDVPKTLVYKLAIHRNTYSNKPIIPLNVIEKPPSAELRPDQKDEDSLPPYEILDPILKSYVEDDRTFAEIVGMGYDQTMVKDIMKLVDRSEYKRRQAPPGIKITPRNFGRDRRMPIANQYKPFQ